MSNNMELSIVVEKRKRKKVSKDLNSEIKRDLEMLEQHFNQKADNNLYDVVVHAHEDKKRHIECPLGNHSVFLLIEDVSENYANDMENSVYYQCACLGCGRKENFKMSIADRRRVVDTHMEPMAALMAFYEVREKYLELKKEQLSNEEITISLNNYYDSLQAKTAVRQKLLK